MDVKNNICKKTTISNDLIVIGRKKMYAGLGKIITWTLGLTCNICRYSFDADEKNHIKKHRVQKDSL